MECGDNGTTLDLVQKVQSGVVAAALVRLKVYLIREVQVLSRHALSGL